MPHSNRNNRSTKQAISAAEGTHKTLRLRRGQSLVEILVATAVGVVMLVGAVMIIAPAIRGNTQAQRTQIAAAYARELMDNVRAFAESNWYHLANLSTGSSSQYYLAASSSPFAAASGTEVVTFGGVPYARSFYLTPVTRDAALQITSGAGAVDPSTYFVTVAYSFPQNATRTFSTYLTRHRSTVYIQTDWSGGAGQDGPATTINARYASSTNIDATSTPGSIFIQAL